MFISDMLSSASQPWPNTATELVMVCETRAPDKNGKILYGANEFIYDKKICRWTIVMKGSS